MGCGRRKDNTFVKRYVLPDYVNTTIGYVKKDNEPIRLDEQVGVQIRDWVELFHC